MPLCALSTGTNNAFPELRETTVAGLAAGLRRDRPRRAGRAACARPRSQVERDGGARDLALVDVAVSARALRRRAGAVAARTTLRELFVDASPTPARSGSSAMAGMLRPLARGGGRALHVRLGAGGRAALDVALAPGLIARVGVASYRELAPGERVELARRGGSIALDGEREIELRAGERGDRAARRRPAARSTSTP